MKILIISPYFPPYNAIGALRIGKLAKYLESDGHDVRVVCARTKELAATLPVEIAAEKVHAVSSYSPDQLLNFRSGKDTSPRPNRPLHRKKSLGAFATGLKNFYLNFFCIPDRFVGWIAPAYFASNRVLKSWRPDLVYASAQPYSALLLGRWIARKHGIPYVAEFRDLWSDNHYLNRPAWRRRLDNWLERKVCADASLLVTVSEMLADKLRAKYHTPCHVTYNGFSETGVASGIPEKRQTLDIVYTGFIYPGKRDPGALFRALSSLGEDAENIRVRFFGRRHDFVRDLAEKEGVSHLVSVEGECTHEEALQYQSNADLLLLLLWDTPEERGVLTGKLFEYLASRRPIIVLGCKDGLAAQLVEDRNAGFVYRSQDELEEKLRTWLKLHRSGGIGSVPAEAMEGFSREKQFSMLVERLGKVPKVAKICIVVSKLDLGGTEQHLLQLLPLINKGNFAVEIITLFGRGELSDAFRAENIRVIEPRSQHALFNLPEFFIRLTVRMIRERKTVFHFWLPAAYILGGICALLTRHRRLVMSRRSLNLYQSRRPLARWLERILHSRMGLILANSHAIAGDLEAEGVRPEKIRIIRNAFDPARLSAKNDSRSVRAEFGISAETVLVICVANLIPYKGHTDLLTAVSQLVSGGDAENIHLLCVGHGTAYRRELEEQADQLMIKDRVTFAGSRKDIADLLAASDISVLASHEEGSSNAVIEAMAMGLPVVATAVGGNVELVEHQETGILVQPQMPEQIAEALSDLIRDRNKRLRLGEAAARSMKSGYSLSACVERYEHAYSELLETFEKPS